MHDEHERGNDPERGQRVDDRVFSPSPVELAVFIIVPRPVHDRIDREEELHENDGAQRNDVEQEIDRGAAVFPADPSADRAPDDERDVEEEHRGEQRVAQKIDVLRDAQCQEGGIGECSVFLGDGVDHFTNGIDSDHAEDGDINTVLRLPGMPVHQCEDDICQGDEQCRKCDAEPHI